MAVEEKKVPLFRSLDTQLDMDHLETSEIESLCMNCHKNGVTRLLLTKIPMFREIIISSFSCEHCGESNSEVQSGATIQDKGVRFTLNLSQTKYLNRMVVKSSSAVFRIPELDFEIPAGTQKGQVTTVESILSRTIENLRQDQPYRMETSPEVATQVEGFIARLQDCLEVKSPFSVVVDDPSGNSFVQGEVDGSYDEALKLNYYKRTKQQDEAIGIFAAEDSGDSGQQAEGEDALTTSLMTDDLISFHGNCSSCQSPVETRMKLVDIPHFNQVVIMATNCEVCGFKTNEVKPGMGVADLGVRITLRLLDSADLSRDMLKSDTASLSVPELQFDVECGTLGGCFTTVEGLLVQARDQLKDAHPFTDGDSAEDSQRAKMQEFIDNLNQVIDGKRLNVHIILDDPAGNSYIQNFKAPETDPELTIEKYERTKEQNEDLGLDHMKTENYTS